MRILVLVAAALAALPAPAILIRPDRDDAEYLELATRYRSAVEIAPGLEGVLIAPRWVLTSATVAARVRDASSRGAALVERPYAIEAIFIHPRWRPGAQPDLALVFLREPVAGVEPTPIFRERDEHEAVVQVVGHGETGRIGAPARRRDARARAAINTVDRIDEATLALRIKGVDEASDLQGELVAAESGAPALLETRQGIRVVGIFSRPEGPWQVFARVSSYADWIDEAMFRAATGPSPRPSPKGEGESSAPSPTGEGASRTR
jgi:hypothetical protein